MLHLPASFLLSYPLLFRICACLQQYPMKLRQHISSDARSSVTRVRGKLTAAIGSVTEANKNIGIVLRVMHGMVTDVPPSSDGFDFVTVKRFTDCGRHAIRKAPKSFDRDGFKMDSAGIRKRQSLAARFMFGFSCPHDLSLVVSTFHTHLPTHQRVHTPVLTLSVSARYALHLTGDANSTTYADCLRCITHGLPLTMFKTMHKVLLHYYDRCDLPVYVPSNLCFYYLFGYISPPLCVPGAVRGQCFHGRCGIPIFFMYL